MCKLKHNKIRNTGLLYEFLLRQITSDVLNDDKISKSVQIIKKRFNENTELGKELTLYNILTTKKFKSDKKAEYFINEVLNARHKLNNSTLKRERYNLIKEIKEHYDLQKFMSSKVKNYKTHASAYKLFEYSTTMSPEQKTESFFNLVEHITTDDNSIKLSETVGTKLPDDEDLRILTYQTLLEKFNQKYTKLNLSQKNLLRAYINNVSGTNSLKEHIEKVVPPIKKEIKKYSKNLKDEVVKIKLKEAIKSIDKFCKVGKSEIVKDSVVVQTMRYMELLKELKKSGSKDKKVI
tara:strand:+ start:128 stop:1006 length:879 start_codon:yes stop_codon:yes gene_type:complete